MTHSLPKSYLDKSSNCRQYPQSKRSWCEVTRWARIGNNRIRLVITSSSKTESITDFPLVLIIFSRQTLLPTVSILLRTWWPTLLTSSPAIEILERILRDPSCYDVSKLLVSISISRGSPRKPPESIRSESFTSSSLPWKLAIPCKVVGKLC